MVGECTEAFNLPGLLQLIHSLGGNQSAGELTGGQSRGAIGTASISGMD